MAGEHYFNDSRPDDTICKISELRLTQVATQMTGLGCHFKTSVEYS